MKPAEIHIQSNQVQCPRCKTAMQLVRHIDLKGMPDIYIFYCNSCQHVETVNEERGCLMRRPINSSNALRFGGFCLFDAPLIHFGNTRSEMTPAWPRTAPLAKGL